LPFRLYPKKCDYFTNNNAASFYKQDLYVKLAYILQRYSTFCYTDINYAFDLKTDDYDSLLNKESRKNLNRAKYIPSELKRAETLEEKKLVYDVIAEIEKQKAIH
jgi:hypothetical protein